MIKNLFWEDFYQILQVHFMAEPEVIKGAYIKLCKKYHPDINRTESAQERMRQINKAYEVLNNPITRKQYLVKWFERHNGENNPIPIKKRVSPEFGFSTEPSKNVLIQYFNAIQKRDFEFAYGFLSEIDRKNISVEDYIQWLTLVAEVFELKRFHCVVDNIYSEAEINNNFFLLVVQYQITVVEKNHVMDRIEEDTFKKNVIFEDNQWRIFLGLVDLASVIKKFRELANLRKKKKYLSLKLKKNTCVRLLSKKEFLLQGEKEQSRMNRYGNVFSIILIRQGENIEMQPDEKNDFDVLSKEIVKELRILDFACQWQEGILIILLPETDNNGACKVMEKIGNKVRKTRPFKLYAIQQKYDNIRMLIQAIITD